MQDTQEEVKKDLLNIFNKKATSLPEWALLVEVARIAKYEPNYQNVTFATRVYYAINDLLQPIKNTWYEITDVNKKNKTLTAIWYEMPRSGVIKKSKEVTWKPDPALWDRLYKNKPLEFFNESRKPYPVPKSTIYLMKGTDENDVENYLNSEKINENLDNLFKPIIDTDIPVMTFEGFIKKMQTKEILAPGFALKNNFDHVDPKDVYDHFKTLVSRKHLTEEELQIFLKKAFELMELPEKRLSFSGVHSKSNIYKIFHSYYKNKASHPSKKQLKYVRLLSNYFEGYNESTVKTNWTK